MSFCRSQLKYCHIIGHNLITSSVLFQETPKLNFSIHLSKSEGYHFVARWDTIPAHRIYRKAVGGILPRAAPEEIKFAKEGIKFPSDANASANDASEFAKDGNKSASDANASTQHGNVLASHVEPSTKDGNEFASDADVLAKDAKASTSDAMTLTSCDILDFSGG